MSAHLDALEAAYQAEHPDVDWATHDVEFTMEWPDKSKPPIFTAVGAMPKVDMTELRAALAKTYGK